MTVVRLHYECLSRRWSQHLNTISVVRWLRDLVRCHKTSHDHGRTSWESGAHESMCKHGTYIRDVAWCQERSHDFSRWLCDTLQSGIATRLLNMTQNRPDVVLGPSMAATSYNIARSRTIHPRWSTITQTLSIADKAQCDHSLRYLKLNGFWYPKMYPSHVVVRRRKA